MKYVAVSARLPNGEPHTICQPDATTVIGPTCGLTTYRYGEPLRPPRWKAEGVPVFDFEGQTFSSRYNAEGYALSAGRCWRCSAYFGSVSAAAAHRAGCGPRLVAAQRVSATATQLSLI